MNIAYESSDGKRYDLITNKIRPTSGNLHEYEWVVEAEEQLYGEKVKVFKKEAIEYSITLTFRGSLEERHTAMDELVNSFEHDIANKTPGRLYFGEYYIQCYMRSGKSKVNGTWNNWSDMTVTAYCPYPLWIYEQFVSVQPLDEAAKTVTDAKGYPYGYTYSYPISQSAVHFTVDHYASSDFQMIVYGPAADINITIAGHPYIVHYQVEAGEYLTIDSRDAKPPDRRIFLTKNNGEKVNVFNYRDSQYSVLQKIPPGDVVIDYNRLYGVDLTLFLERSEPKWI